MKRLYILMCLFIITLSVIGQIVESRWDLNSGLYGFVDKNDNWIVKPEFKYAFWYAKGEFGSLETKDGREKAQAAYDQAASEIRKSENLKKPVVIIKSTPQASFGSLVEILDEMQINSISKYQIDNMTRADSVMLIDFQNRNHAN